MRLQSCVQKLIRSFEESYKHGDAGEEKTEVRRGFGLPSIILEEKEKAQLREHVYMSFPTPPEKKKKKLTLLSTKCVDSLEKEDPAGAGNLLGTVQKSVSLSKRRMHNGSECSIADFRRT